MTTEEEYDQQCRLVVQGVQDALREHPQDARKPVLVARDPKSTQTTFDVLVLDALHGRFAPEVLVPVLDFLLPGEPQEPPFARLRALMECAQAQEQEPAFHTIRLVVQIILESLVHSPHRMSFAGTYEMLHWRAPPTEVWERALREQRSNAGVLGLPPGVFLVGDAAAAEGSSRKAHRWRQAGAFLPDWDHEQGALEEFLQAYETFRPETFRPETFPPETFPPETFRLETFPSEKEGT